MNVTKMSSVKVGFTGKSLRQLRTVLKYLSESEANHYCQCGHDKKHTFSILQQIWPLVFKEKLRCWCGEQKG